MNELRMVFILYGFQRRGSNIAKWVALVNSEYKFLHDLSNKRMANARCLYMHP